VKLSTLGASFDRELCRRNLGSLVTQGGRSGAAVELDMEGRGLVGLTLGTAIALGRERKDFTVTLQAYLDRTFGDLARMVENGIRVRLVKGAYLGDTGDFVEIQGRMKRLAGKLLESGVRFCVGTHDPELIHWLEENADRTRLQLGFLMGLADETKLRLAKDRWDVIEYVPFGNSNPAYIARRQNYLRSLDAMGKKPAP
jgi:proline dehydrogenase